MATAGDGDVSTGGEVPVASSHGEEGVAAFTASDLVEAVLHVQNQRVAAYDEFEGWVQSVCLPARNFAPRFPAP